MTTLLVVDIGNTNVSLGLFDYPRGAGAPVELGQGERSAGSREGRVEGAGAPVELRPPRADGERSPRGRLAQHWRTSTHREQTSDEAALVLSALFAHEGRRAAEVSDVIISSVVPPLLPIWERVSTKLFERPPLVVGPGTRTGMPVRYENPREVGADRIVNAVAALDLLGGPVIAVDFGTATTFDCVSREGEYLGGAIFPGIGISMEALFERASMLHRVELARPKSVIGRTTTAALQSGLLYGYAGVVDSMVERIRGELGKDARVVATGGLASRVSAESRTIERVEPFLTLEGLRLIFEKNRPHPEASRKERST